MKTAAAMRTPGALRDAVIRVGPGRGFLVEDQHGLMVITAAHCLPWLPPCLTFSYTSGRTFKKLLGALGEAPTIWAECVFVDPISDVAVLAEPDGQALFDACAAFEAFVEGRPTLRPKRLTEARTDAWVLTLAASWKPCSVERSDFTEKYVNLPNTKIAGGMSGSPIVLSDGSVVGVIGSGGSETQYQEQSAVPACLPLWLQRKRRVGARA